MRTAAILLLLLLAAPDASAETCTAARNPELCAQLLGMSERAEIARQALTDAPQSRLLRATVDAVDGDNVIFLERIVDRYGWPGRSLAGDRASAFAWTVIQRASLATQKKYLPLMTAAAHAGELDPALVAETIDRIRLADALVRQTAAAKGAD